MPDRNTIESVIQHNKLDKMIDKEFVQEHTTAAWKEIDRILGSDWDISNSTYPELYDEAVKKQAYIFMLPFLNLFYKTEYDESVSERAQFYLSPEQTEAKLSALQTRVNYCVETLINDAQTVSQISERVYSGSSFTIMAAGGNSYYKRKFREDKA